MPRVSEIQHHGKKRWRVIVPPIGRERRKIRIFKNRAQAVEFAAGLKGLRDSSLQEFMQLEASVRGRLVHCLAVAGGIDALEWSAQQAAGARVEAEKTLGKACLLCVEAKRNAGRSWQYVENLGIALGLFSQGRTHVHVSAISGKEISDWLNAGAWSPETRATYLRRLDTFFRFAQKQGWTIPNPCSAVEKPSIIPGLIRILSVPECVKLLETCRQADPSLLPYFAIGLFAGLRPDEIKRLSTEDVREGWIHVQAGRSKTRRRRLVEIHPALAEWLKVAGGQIGGWRNWRRRFREVCQRSGLGWSSDVMRHSFCSYSYPIRGAIWTAEHAGHSERVLFARYRELVPREEAERFWEIKP